ncbi:MAG TPA: trimethylamine methyltransferase family protein, partial [bacterium]|nr:trimethylamine methyltransferase family protein [bacterium]
EKMIIDYEIFRFAKHIVEGFEFKDRGNLVEIIDECVKEGTFLAHQDTLNNYRKILFESDLFSNDNFMAWDREGRKSLLDRARTKAMKLLGSHSFTRDKEQQKELDKIWEKAKQM